MLDGSARDICVSTLIWVAAGWSCCIGLSGGTPAAPAVALTAALSCADLGAVPGGMNLSAGALKAGEARFPCERFPTAYNWQSVKIVDGGVMPGIYTHPTEPGLMYIRANVGGAYRWNAPGQMWLPLTDWLGGTDADWSLMGIESIALDPTDPNRLYLAAGMYIEPWLTINGAILTSKDRGRTFQRVNLPFKLGANDNYGQQGGERLAVNPFQPSELYLGTHENGLWLSADYGITWSQMANFPITASPDLVGGSSSASTRGSMAPCMLAPTPVVSTAPPTTAPHGSRCPASQPLYPMARRYGPCAAHSVPTACCT